MRYLIVYMRTVYYQPCKNVLLRGMWFGHFQIRNWDHFKLVRGGGAQVWEICTKPSLRLNET